MIISKQSKTLHEYETVRDKIFKIVGKKFPLKITYSGMDIISISDMENKLTSAQSKKLKNILILYFKLINDG